MLIGHLIGQLCYHIHISLQEKSYPQTPQAFIREWRCLNKKTADQYSYLLDIGAARLETIFSNEIGFGLLGEFLNTFNDQLKSEDRPDVVTILDHLKNTKRFSLTVQFLSSNEKKYCSELFQKLDDLVDKVAQNEEQNSLRCKIDDIKKFYGIK